MVAQLAKDLPGQEMVAITLEDRDSLLLTVAQLAEESLLLRRELGCYRERYGHLVSKRQVAARFRAGAL